MIVLSIGSVQKGGSYGENSGSLAVLEKLPTDVVLTFMRMIKVLQYDAMRCGAMSCGAMSCAST